MVKDLKTKLSPYTTNNVYRVIFEEFYDLSDTGIYLGVLGISSDGDDRRIFLGLKFLIPGFFLGTKIWQVFFLGSLI